MRGVPEEAACEDEVELAVQVNGKVRGRIKVAREPEEETVRRKALEEGADQVQGKWSRSWSSRDVS